MSSHVLIVPYPMAAGSEMMECLGLVLSTTLTMIVDMLLLYTCYLKSCVTCLVASYSISIVSMCIIVGVLTTAALQDRDKLTSIVSYYYHCLHVGCDN